MNMSIERRKEMNHRRKRGVAIEFVLIAMVLVAGLVVAILTSATLTVRTARSQNTYIEKKQFLDDVAKAFIAQIRTSGEPDDFPSQYEGNSYNFEFDVKSTSLTVKQNSRIVLLVELQEIDSEYKLVTYKYGMT